MPNFKNHPKILTTKLNLFASHFPFCPQYLFFFSSFYLFFFFPLTCFSSFHQFFLLLPSFLPLSLFFVPLPLLLKSFINGLEIGVKKCIQHWKWLQRFNTKKNISLYVNCYRSVQSGEDDEGLFGFLPSEVRKIVAGSRQVACTYCNQMGGTCRSVSIQRHLGSDL